jgi:hypothetical protein
MASPPLLSFDRSRTGHSVDPHAGVRILHSQEGTLASFLSAFPGSNPPLS